jgi:hypothetical protein
MIDELAARVIGNYSWQLKLKVPFHQLPANRAHGNFDSQVPSVFRRLAPQQSPKYQRFARE